MRPPPRHRIGRPRLGFLPPRPESRSSDSVRPSARRSTARPRRRRTLRRCTPCRLPDSRRGGRGGGHAVPLRAGEPIQRRPKASHHRRQVRDRRAILRVRQTARYDRVASGDGRPGVGHACGGGCRKRRGYYSDKGRSFGGREEGGPQLSYCLGGHWRRTTG
jgi:hypothetical protein